MKYNRPVFLSTSIYVLIIIYFLILNHSVYAVEVNDFRALGNTVDIHIEEILKEKKGNLSKENIESIGVEITNEYHKRGYVTSYVDRLVLKKNGVLEIHIQESGILGIKVSGIEGRDARDIKLLILPVKGEIYNRFTLKRRIKEIKSKFNIESIKVYPVNHDDSADVFLSVEIEKSRGNFYGGIGIEPIYGLSPRLGYFYPFNNYAVDLFSRIGYREGELRRIEGDIKYYIFSDNNNMAYYIGANSSRLIEHWESVEGEYKSLSITPVIGARYMRKYIRADLFAGEIITEIRNYKEDKYTNYDTRLTLDMDISNRYRLLVSEESTDLKVTLSGGVSKLDSKGYIISSMNAKTSISPFVWLRFIPKMNIYYTTSDERFLWSYVYDKNLLGFFDDFTASGWKNIGGIDAEFEISTQFVYAGPFINGGYFNNESDEWRRATGSGMKVKIIHKKLFVEIYYAWDLSYGPSKGGLFIHGGGRI